jgi:Tol biopolymer transport system component
MRMVAAELTEKGESGGRIAFVRIVSSEGGDRGDLHTVAPDGSGLAPLTGSEGWDSYPAWSPHGERLLFVRTTPRSSDLWDFVSELCLVNPDGTGLTTVMRTDWVTIRPAWSPDGKRIIFASTARERLYNLYVINIDGTGLTRITDGPPHAEMPAWSPDGNLIAFVTPIEHEVLGVAQSLGHAIWVMNADGTQPHQLTEGRYSDHFPAWSADGSKILFSRSLEDENVPSGRGRALASALFILTADGSKVNRVTQDTALYESPGWSPDGSKIVCCKYEGRRKYVCVMNTDGSDQRAVTNPTNAHDHDPSWGRVIDVPSLPTLESTP